MKVEKFKDPGNVTNAVDDVFQTVTEKLDIYHVRKIHWYKIWTSLHPGCQSASATSLIETQHLEHVEPYDCNWVGFCPVEQQLQLAFCILSL